MRKLFLIALSILVVAIVPEIIQAKERYAVLVGVGQYPNLRESLQLNGPPNDVQLMREYLTNVEEFSEDHVICLTDDGPQLPTHANILAALENLKEKLATGDFALLYFSGHGSQQPDEPGADKEYDGHDEIFLPADVKKWSKGKQAVENAIVDDEIGDFISAYRHKGVDVWIVFDSCHSGTMTRGVGDEIVRTRKVLPKDLGIPDTFSDKRVQQSRGHGDSDVSDFTDTSTESSASNLGELIQFFAARANEETIERLLPRGAKVSEQDTMGLFTHSLVSVLFRYPDVSYDALAQMIIAEYASIPHYSSRPQFNGTNMDQRVFGGGSEHNLAFRATLDTESKLLAAERAGKLRGFDKGATVSIHPNAADTSMIGTGVVTEATLTESTIAPNWKKGAAVPHKKWKPVHIRLVQPAYKPTVRISEIETIHDADNLRLRDIINALEKDNISLVEFSDYDPDADYFAAFFDDKFWLLRPGQTLPCSVQLITEEERRKCERTRVPESLFWSSPDDTRTLVSRAAKARNLVKLQSFSNVPASLKLKVEIERKNGIDHPVDPKTGRFSLGELKGLLKAGDKVYVSASNRSRDAWDIFFFYVDSNLDITPMQDYGESAQVKSKAKIDMLVGTVTNQTVGTESLVIIADPNRDGKEANYYFLAQEGYEKIATRGKGNLRSPQKSPLQLIMEGVWKGDKNALSRSMDAPSPQGPQAHIRVFTWRVE